MHIKRIEYSALFNLGDYENQKFSLSADLEEGESVDEAMTTLKSKVIEMAGDGAKNAWEERWRVQREIEDLTKKVEQARATWSTVSEFMRAQGLKSDPAEFPDLTKLLPAAPKPDSESVVTAEFDDIPL